MNIDIKAFYDLSYGVYIVGSCLDGKPNAMIANSVMQVTACPEKLAICVNKESLTHEYILKRGFLSVQAIKEGSDMVFIGNFGFRTGRNFDKFAKYKFNLTQNNLPAVLENTLDIFEIKTEQTIDLKTHTMFIGNVVSAEVLSGEGKPLTYNYYQTVMRGKTPRGATTFKG
ncbi:MAG: flavin reductase family protein [Elusimicrobiota bacterium]|jgi:ferric-chelate reductase [NAD(P)H]|nr:flavin reductase family protein [Elusimicrobiota bacterium]